MTEGSHRAPDDTDKVPEGVSAFVAKVLDQLSLSAWLPAAVFAASVTMLTEFRSQKSLAVGNALKAVTDHPAPILILALPVLILATMVTQAFSYGAIRTLEGYWRRRGPIGWLRNLLIRWHFARRSRLEKARIKAIKRAFDHARPEFLARYSYAIVGALELQSIGKRPTGLSDDDAKKLKLLTWRTFCTPWDLAKVDQCASRLKDYPLRPWRTMPTMLGNVLRATEDSLKNAGDDVEGFAMRRRDQASSRVLLHHDQFRSRLDMYCTLVIVSVILAGVSAAMLAEPIKWWQTTIFGVAYLVSPGSAMARP